MNKSRRILRDVSIVIIFCVGFLGLIGLANFLQDDSAEQTSSEFSQHRLSADKAAQGHDFEVSLENLRALVENDPFDGRAQYALASTLFTRFTEIQDAIAEANRKELTDADDAPDQVKSTDQVSSDTRTNSPSPSANDTQTAQARDAEAKVLLDQAIHEYRLAEEHPRYRLRSQIQLAVLLATKGEYKAALNSLDNFVNEGGATRRGLDQIEEFGSYLNRNQGPTKLHAYPKFAEIVERERRNRGNRGHFRRFENRGNNSAQPKSQLSANGDPAWSQGPGFWRSLKRLNDYLVTYRIKLVDFVRELFK